MDKYNDTFNMFIGIGDKELKWDDNPYIKANVYEISEDWNPKLSDKVKLRQCTKEDMT